jgi:murein tripeptide amidase MpaA
VIIRADFDGGNIVVHDEVTLGIRHDSHAPEFRQWFSFQVHDAEPTTLRIVDLANTSYPGAWEGYDVCTSFDGETWFRTPAELADDALVFEVPAAPLVHFAYFAPYDLDRHRALLAEAPAVVIGKTVQGRDLHMVTVGDGPLDLWVIARQHPGETMAEWFAEGLLGKLLDDDDPIAQLLRERATLHVVPNMNPDGSFLGNLRANAAGMNLNRAWLEPDAKRSPEVLAVRRLMEQTGVDLFLDIHGDEQNPYCFLAGCEGNPSYTDRLRDLENLFEQSLLQDNDDFQDEYGYDRDEPGGGDLRTAGNWVGERFDCLSMTLEMPFKDASNNPDEVVGFSPDRARRLGGSTLDAIAATLDDLRST